MANIYIVNHTTSGYYASTSSSYHHTEEDARTAYAEALESVDEDPASIELVRLDAETLDGVTLEWWEGSVTDLESQEDDEGEE